MNVLINILQATTKNIEFSMVSYKHRGSLQQYNKEKFCYRAVLNKPKIIINSYTTCVSIHPKKFLIIIKYSKEHINIKSIF